ncbi:MAG: AAA family ATPase [Bdellovibrionales bacterium RIFOXYB1_FULL_37_110]|nr:MAG: AAA family ATPase [Bdellovibrionales bacterium RIFOXYC1_FULL_37_79]OFZ57092.1 MAG: AAA family ATPase [Bdellovibrionales bacterium RIFOXYB1_FULL_37_110]OFZ62057.1 MAG: AAA family ATPase [Bdellovibrionales bacterium RIFOXYD1_FULL_36_51]
MDLKIRYLHNPVTVDLKEKMVFIGGPRQVGKTTMSRSIAGLATYLNFDNLQDKKIILKGQFFPNYSGLVILDEIHKYRLWRNLIKGEFDKFYPDINFLITGSAQLDYFRKGGDSLVGRYHYYRLHPFSVSELDKNYSRSTLEDLFNFSGFPEPFFKANTRALKRWQMERINRVVEQDVRDLSMIKDISNLTLLAEILPSRVGSLLSVKSLAEDLMVSPHTINNYLDIFENIYLSFRIYPYGVHKLKAIKKTPKIFLWDWTQVEMKGPRFENLVASHLLKYCHFHTDYNGDKMELRFLKDVEGREVDFVVLKNNKPQFMVECKSGDRALSPSLSYYQTRHKIPMAYQVHMGTQKKGNPLRGGMLLPFTEFCKEVQLV